MPCYSTVQKTTMTNHDRLAKALEALGWTIDYVSEVQVRVYKQNTPLVFTRRRAGEAFTTESSEAINPIQRKYTELGVKAWAKTKGFSVIENDGRRLVLMNRRA